MKSYLYLVIIIFAWMNCFPLASMDKPIDKPMPIIAEATLPLYPPNARVANISGTVKLKVTTDGIAVSRVVAVEGPPMLSIAAKAMISEWKFLKHDPIEFVITIQYNLITVDDRVNDIVSFDVTNKIIVNGVRTKA